LLDDVDLARRLGAAGKARVLSQFGLEAMVDQYTSLYRELLG